MVTITEKSATVGIGEAAAAAGVTQRQLRHWEDVGYLNLKEKVSCGVISYRRYSAEDVELIKRIKTCLDEGFKLSFAVKKAKQGGSIHG